MQPSKEPANPDSDIDNEIEDLEEHSMFSISKDDLSNFGRNFWQFLKFYKEVLCEDPVAESDPAYFLPSLAILAAFVIGSAVCFFNVFSILPGHLSGTFFYKGLMSFLLSFIFCLGIVGGLKISTILFHSTVLIQDIAIAAAIFTLPAMIGLFFFWLFSYASLILSFFLLFIGHSTAIVGIYAAMPKVLLLKGGPRFFAILFSLGTAVFSVGILLRIFA